MSGSIYYPRRSIVSNTYYKVIYLDLNTNYQITSSQIELENVDAIGNEIFNLLTTSPGERPFEPTFGSGLVGLLFAPTTADTGQQMMDKIYIAFNTWIQNVKLDLYNSSVSVDQFNGAFYVQLACQIQGLTNTALYNITLRK